MSTIIFGLAMTALAYVGIRWSGDGINALIKLVFIGLSIACGLYFLNGIGVTNFNLG